MAKKQYICKCGCSSFEYDNYWKEYCCDNCGWTISEQQIDNDTEISCLKETSDFSKENNIKEEKMENRSERMREITDFLNRLAEEVPSDVMTGSSLLKMFLENEEDIDRLGEVYYKKWLPGIEDRLVDKIRTGLSDPRRYGASQYSLMRILIHFAKKGNSPAEFIVRDFHNRRIVMFSRTEDVEKAFALAKNYIETSPTPKATEEAQPLAKDFILSDQEPEEQPQKPDGVSIDSSTFSMGFVPGPDWPQRVKARLDRVNDRFHSLAVAVVADWKTRAVDWWNSAGRIKGICDDCNHSLICGEGFLVGRSLICEDCAIRRLTEHVNWDKAIVDPDWVFGTVSEHVRRMAEKLSNVAAPEGAKDTMRIGNVMPSSSGELMVGGTLTSKPFEVGSTVTIQTKEGVVVATVEDSIVTGQRVMYRLQGEGLDVIKEGDFIFIR